MECTPYPEGVFARIYLQQTFSPIILRVKTRLMLSITSRKMANLILNLLRCIINQQSEPSPGNFWKSLWKRDIPPKWKIFCRKIINKAIPTSASLKRRNIQVEGICPLCGAEDESDSHLFRDFSINDHIWRTMGLGISTSAVECVDVGSQVLNFLNLFFKKTKMMS